MSSRKATIVPYAIQKGEEHYLEFVPQAIDEIVPESSRLDYSVSGTELSAPNTHHAKVRVRKILDRARELWLERFGSVYAVEFSGKVYVRAESEEQAELFAENKILIEDLDRRVTKMEY